MNELEIDTRRNFGYAGIDNLVDGFVSEIEDLERIIRGLQGTLLELEGKINDLESELEEAQQEDTQ